ncbi:MAG: hypothetical protein DMG05_23700 [Acidobacteria bacterium]|nr:MAG: hypothetical protein DMG05_23700 [Acidobacteriota bacterium]
MLTLVAPKIWFNVLKTNGFLTAQKQIDQLAERLQPSSQLFLSEIPIYKTTHRGNSKEGPVQSQPIKQTALRPKSKIACYEICCEACNLSQIHHGPTHVHCIHCKTRLDLRKLKPKYQ